LSTSWLVNEKEKEEIKRKDALLLEKMAEKFMQVGF